MYNPSPFLISSAALTSIFSFFFGGYFREREKACRYLIGYLAYDVEPGCETETRSLCAELESKDRVFRQAKDLLLILLLTLFVEFVVFQFYCCNLSGNRRRSTNRGPCILIPGFAP